MGMSVSFTVRESEGAYGLDAQWKKRPFGWKPAWVRLLVAFSTGRRGYHMATTVKERLDKALNAYRTRGLTSVMASPARIFAKPRFPKGITPPKGCLDALGERQLGDVLAGEYVAVAAEAIINNRQATVAAVAKEGELAIDATAGKSTFWSESAADEIAGNFLANCLAAGCPPYIRPEPKAEVKAEDEDTVGGEQSQDTVPADAAQDPVS